MVNSNAWRHPGSADPVKDATVSALARVLDPLLELLFDAGVTVQELNQIARSRAIHIATKRVIKESGRESKSRVEVQAGPTSRAARSRRLARRSPFPGLERRSRGAPDIREAAQLRAPGGALWSKHSGTRHVG